MWNALYHIIVIGLAVWGILTGYRKGLMRQLGSVIAVAFGIVLTIVLAPDFTPIIDGMIPDFVSGFNREFIVQTLSCTIIYVFTSGLLELVLMPLGKLMKVMPGGILDSIGGAIFRPFRYLLLISLFYNLIIDFNPSGPLTRVSRLHDGNVVEGVIKMAPGIMRFPGGEEVAHYQQLEDARKISQGEIRKLVLNCRFLS